MWPGPSLPWIRHCLLYSHASILVCITCYQWHLGTLSKDVFEPRTSTGSEAFSLFICLDTNKLVLLSFFSLLKTIYPRVSTKSFPSDAKSPLPVDVRRSKTLLLKLPILWDLSSVGAVRKVSPNWSQETMTCHSSNCFSIVWGHGNAPQLFWAAATWAAVLKVVDQKTLVKRLWSYKLCITVYI